MCPFDSSVVNRSNNAFQMDSTAVLTNKITSFSKQMDLAEYHFLRMLAEFDLRRAWFEPGVGSLSYWLNLHCDICDCTAREKVRVARCLNKLPMINQQFEAGELSYSKVRALTRIATDENESALLEVAQNHSANYIEKYVKRFRRIDENQRPIVTVDELEQRRMDYYQDEDGMWVIKAKLPQVEGGLFVKAIEEVIRQTKSAAETKSVQLTNVSAESPLAQKSSISQKRADALTGIAEHFIATATVDENNGVKALAGHERCQVVLHVDENTLKHAHEHGDDCDCGHEHQAANLDLNWLSMKTAKRIGSDASILTVLENKYGEVLNHGRNTRTITGPLKRAIDIRDETCRFPGCCNNLYVDIHHIMFWSNGGETEADNLIKLCRFHHHLLHRGHYSIEFQRNNSERPWLFKTPMGKIIEKR